jgi:hypothetical protein
MEEEQRTVLERTSDESVVRPELLDDALSL